MQPAKYQAIALGMFLMVGAFTGCLGDDDDDTTTDTTVTKTAVKIGFLNPLTGPLEPDAPGFAWAANEAIADLNAASTTHTYELVEVDSACDGTPAAAGAQTLIDSGVVAVAGAACSGASMGANAVLSAAGIPMISYASTNPGLSDATAYPLFYRIVPSDAIQGPAGADMMADGGVTNGSLAILHMTNDYGSGLADSIKAAWEDDGHALCGAGMQGYEDTATDFSALAQSVVDNTDCTAVYLSSYITDAAGIIEALNDKGYTGQIYGGDGPAGIGLYEKLTDNSMAENMTVSAPRAGSTYGTFEARYDADNATIGSIKTYVLTTYDAVTIIGQAAAMSGAINDNIKTTGTGFEGSSGLLTFLDNGDVGGAGYDICTYGGADESYTCGKYWTAIGGVQDSS
jgi:branched-chain amino acid transport system substrate-binding protein